MRTSFKTKQKEICEAISDISPLNFIEIFPCDEIMLISFRAWREAENEIL